MTTGPIRPTVQLVAVPSGFTLAVGGSLAVAADRYRGSGFLPIWLFVVGGSTGFALLALSSGAHRILSPEARLRGGLAALNVVPIGVIPANYLAIRWLSMPDLGYPLAGLVAVVLYVTAYSAFVAAINSKAAVRAQGQATSSQQP